MRIAHRQTERWSVAESYDQEFDKANNPQNEYYQNNKFVLGKLPEYFKDYGLDPSLDLTYTAKHLRNAVRPKDEDTHYHGLSKDKIKSAIEKLDNPAMVFYNPLDDRGIIGIMVDEYDSNEDSKIPVIVYVQPWVTDTANNKRVITNHVLSIYAYNDEDKFHTIIDNAIKHKNVIKFDKSKVGIINANLGNPISDIGMNKADFNLSIKKYGKIVKDIIQRKRLDPRFNRFQKEFNEAYKRMKSTFAKFSIKGNNNQDNQMDRDYFAAVERYEKSGDDTELREMVSAAAKRAGYTEEVYHGTNSDDYDVMKDGSGQYGNGAYFTYDEDLAKTYGKNVRKFYVKAKDLGTYNRNQEKDGIYKKAFPEVEDWSKQDYAYGEDPYSFDDNPRLQEELMAKGYNGFEDEGNAGFVLWNHEGNVKSADAVVRDDNGEIIPPSRRFNSQKKDMWWSLKAAIPEEKQTLKDLGFSDQELENDPIPTVTEEGRAGAETLVTVANQIIEGLIGDTRSVADRSKPDYLYHKAKQPDKTIETEFEMKRRNKIEKSMKQRTAEDGLILEHLDADKNLITGLIRKNIKPGPLQDWMLKKVARVLAPFQAAKPVESLLYTIAENLMWDETQGKMVIAPQRNYIVNPDTNEARYEYDDNKEIGQIALDYYNKKLSPEFRAISLTMGNSHTIVKPIIVNQDGDFAEVIDCIRNSLPDGVTMPKVKPFGWNRDTDCYQDIKISLRFPNGGIGEIIVIDNVMFQMKMKNGGHTVYDITRILEKYKDENQKIHNVWADFQQLDKALYNRYGYDLEEFERLKDMASDSLTRLLGKAALISSRDIGLLKSASSKLYLCTPYSEVSYANPSLSQIKNAITNTSNPDDNSVAPSTSSITKNSRDGKAKYSVGADSDEMEQFCLTMGNSHTIVKPTIGSLFSSTTLEQLLTVSAIFDIFKVSKVEVAL